MYFSSNRLFMTFYVLLPWGSISPTGYISYYIISNFFSLIKGFEKSFTYHVIPSISRTDHWGQGSVSLFIIIIIIIIIIIKKIIIIIIIITYNFSPFF